MATAKKTIRKKVIKTTSPFKSKAKFEKEITDFANKFKTTVVNQASRISEYFEMSCFNLIVKFYELNGYTLTVENLQQNKYRYKCTPSGIQSNFSHFKAEIDYRGTLLEFEIQHNLAVQSSQDPSIFTSPDISIIRSGSTKYRTDYYDTKTTFSHVLSTDLFTFCEVKQFTPFPELLFNFIGVVNELRHQVITDTSPDLDTVHIAPSLMISGKPNKPVKNIKDSLEGRYCINIIFDLVYSSAATFSRKNINNLRKAGRLPVKVASIFSTKKASA